MPSDAHDSSVRSARGASARMSHAPAHARTQAEQTQHGQRLYRAARTGRFNTHTTRSGCRISRDGVASRPNSHTSTATRTLSPEVTIALGRHLHTNLPSAIAIDDAVPHPVSCRNSFLPLIAPTIDDEG
eukprot:6131544-Pleurochrysis_carterae.AAC.1